MSGRRPALPRRHSGRPVTPLGAHFPLPLRALRTSPALHHYDPVKLHLAFISDADHRGLWHGLVAKGTKVASGPEGRGDEQAGQGRQEPHTYGFRPSRIRNGYAEDRSRRAFLSDNLLLLNLKHGGDSSANLQHHRVLIPKS